MLGGGFLYGPGTHRPLGKPAPKPESAVPQWTSPAGPA
jgi:hypothetical protein